MRAGALKQLPCPLQIVQVARPTVENAWIADLQLRDGMATSTRRRLFVATIGYQGPGPRSDVQVVAHDRRRDGGHADGRFAARPGSARSISRPTRSTCRPSRASRPTSRPRSPCNPDRSPAADDHRFLVVPVVASLPVVFVDQHWGGRGRSKNRFGETLAAPLLAPRRARRRRATAGPGPARGRRPARPRAAGRRPAGGHRRRGAARGPTSPLLQEYVEQGGIL